ncbi:Leucine rich repeat protein of unknown function [endosymbiont DhMRE of Dentiscutata heterogama]|uniref:leucine-rich repeat domain-containing protein n=1 Tax=endosymbiont DhMRE of Dentiscutata heterogama TaxID=1609546 RepID=UPI000629D654|nr:leucine-rich repeat domain-containing protein [endosymbiont DhMRE of Dentiscutata heterogama]CFW92821.1 Leucine rich repeat protein of unknown function [endosymbiont DhMRE of Dentiscutata heterogama]
MVNAQEWLQSNYSYNKGKRKGVNDYNKKDKKHREKKTEITATLDIEKGTLEPFTPITPVFPGREPTITGDYTLEGELKIENYPNLKTISLFRTGGITKLTIANCPNLETLNVAGNKIKQIVGLENCPKLKMLNICANEIEEVDVSKNVALQSLVVGNNNRQTKIRGLEKLPNLFLYNGEGGEEGVNLPLPVQIESANGGGSGGVNDSIWKNDFLEKVIGNGASGVKDSEGNKVNEFIETATSLRKAINNLRLLDIDLENPKILEKESETGEIKFSWEKDWEILADILDTLNWDDLKRKWEDYMIDYWDVNTSETVLLHYSN